jgi:hypothetical protein
MHAKRSCQIQRALRQRTCENESLALLPQMHMHPLNAPRRAAAALLPRQTCTQLAVPRGRGPHSMHPSVTTMTSSQVPPLGMELVPPGQDACHGRAHLPR